MGWLVRLVTGGPTGGRGPPTVLEFLVINFSVCLMLLSIGSFSLVVFHILLLHTVASA